ncbi:DEAD/DEAH box helicase [uncultured Bacteroides sp.]|uniref:DEAD/DEAH box helicase n=1 Tax=uncultured Bacteroides sp. TaxID=162156 RepID=UPI002AA79D7C|nr:DEAD/DEAH box helicase [uncultured Bacteroides sp.]
MKENLTPIRIVIVLTQHPVLGALLVPYTAQRESEDTICLIEQAFHVSHALVAKMNEAEQKAIEIANHYTEKYLMKIYSKEKNSSDFLRKLSDKTRKEVVRPYIEKKLLEMVQLIQTQKLPLYEKQTGSNQLYNHNAYQVMSETTEVSFQFTGTDKQFSYTIQCRCGDITVPLQEKKPVIALTSSPASLLLGRELHVFRNIEAARILPFTHKKSVSVDASFTAKYMEKIVAPVIKYHEVTSTGLNITEEHREYEPLLWVEDSVHLERALELKFRYGDQTFLPNPSAASKVVQLCEENGEKAIHYFERNLLLEKESVELLKKAGLRQVSDGQFTLRQTTTPQSLSEWIAGNKKILSTRFKLISEKTGGDYCLNDIHVEQTYTDEHDWFELHITVVVEGLRIPFIRFKKHILEGIKEYVLPDGRTIILPEEWFSKYVDLFEVGEEEEKTIRLKHPFIGILQSVTASDEKEKTHNYQPKRIVETPDGFNAQLRRYQQEGLSWMVHLHEHNLNGCLADDMGLGKTIQTLALLQYIYNKTTNQSAKKAASPTISADEIDQLPLFPASVKPAKQHASLIVMPTSLLHNWKREAARFTNLSIYEYAGGNHLKQPNPARAFNQHHLVLTSYGIMRNNIAALSQYPFEYIVLDESQNIKNSDSQTFKAAMTLKSSRRLVLTGTPIENSLKDLWSQFHFLEPELLGTESDFNKRFILPIRQEDHSVEQRLKQIIEPFILRRSKLEVAPELPSLTEEILYCNMTEKQLEIYEREKNGLRNILLDLKEHERKQQSLTILNGILRLRQLACHPQMVFNAFAEGSGKLEEIINTFETLQSEGHKVLIFSSFVKHLELIAKAFDERGWAYAMLTGSSTKREEEINRFSSDDRIQAFLISLKAGGVGLNLTQADYIFIIDPWWNPAAEMQAVSRAHRIGQKKQVMAYRFITQDSIEEKMMQLQESKRKLAETFITDNNPLESLTDTEWKKLLE